MYIGEIATLWKNEFQSLDRIKPTATVQEKKQNRLHKITGQKILNFVFNLSRRALLLYESRMDDSKSAKVKKT